jgi:hypothetical protein
LFKYHPTLIFHQGRKYLKLFQFKNERNLKYKENKLLQLLSQSSMLRNYVAAT